MGFNSGFKGLTVRNTGDVDLFYGATVSSVRRPPYYFGFTIIFRHHTR